MENQIREFTKRGNRKRLLKRVVSLLCAVVLLFTMNTLKRTANTLERIATCGLQEHAHTAGCYNSSGELVCAIPEHVHTDACYQQSPSNDLVLNADGLEIAGDLVDAGGTQSLDLSLDLDQGDLLDFVQDSGDQGANVQDNSNAMPALDGDLSLDVPNNNEETQRPAANASVEEAQRAPAESVDETPSVEGQQPTSGAEIVIEGGEQVQPAENGQEQIEYEEKAEQPAEETQEQPAEETQEQPAEETQEQPAEETQEQPAEETQEQPAEETQEQPAEETQEQPAEETQEQPAEETQEQPAEETQEQPAEETQEQPAEETQEQPAEETQEQPAEETQEQPAEETQEQPAEETQEQPAEETQEQPAEETQQSVEGAQSVVEDSDQIVSEETEQPVVEETEKQPTEEETQQPTEEETQQPTGEETEQPTGEETQQPTGEETEQPTGEETEQPTEEETQQPTEEETQQPTGEETEQPTGEETEQPTGEETEQPTGEETEQPTGEETEQPTGEETQQPTEEETEQPTGEETQQPTGEETEQPTGEETEQPTGEETEQPTGEETEQPTEEETEQQPAEVESGAEVGSEPEAGGESEEEPEAQLAYPAQQFQQGTAYINVFVDAPKGAFPEGTVMVVRDVEDQGTIDNIQQSVTEDFVEVTSVHAVDISFWYKDTEIEPLLPIDVVMSAVEAPNADHETVVVHVDDNGETELVDSESTGAAEAALQMPATADPEAQAFQADTFSVYALVTKQAIETKYIDEQGETWRIRVEYNKEAKIPEGATLRVSEVVDDSYLTEAEAALESGKRITKARFFDIAIMYGDREVQPEAEVNVIVTLEGNEGEIEATDNQADIGNPDVVAMHFEEKNDEIVGVEKKSAVETEEGVAFKADGFSVWGVVYTVDFEVEGDQGEITLDFTAFDALTLPEAGEICYNTEDCSIHVALGLLSGIVSSEAEAGYDIDVNANLVNNYEFDFDKAEMGKADSGIRFEGGELVIASDGFVELTEGERLLRVRATGLTALKQALLETEGASIEVVEGNVPLGSEVSYSAHTDEETAQLVENYINNTEENGDSEVAGYSAADLKIVRNDETLPVEGQFKVTVDKASLVPEGMKLDKLYHIHRDENGEAVVEPLKAEPTEDGLGLVFEVENFSDIVASYTVDFEYVDENGNVHTWHFPGTGSYNLRTVLTALDIEFEEINKATLTPVEIVGEETEGGLFLTQDADGEWFINSLAPFDDTYELAIITDVKGYVIKVTDAQGDPYTIEFKFYDASGNPVNPNSFGTNYWYFATDTQLNNDNVSKNYFNWQQLTDLNTSVKTITITQFSVGNGNPNYHSYNRGETVTVDFFTSPDGDPQIKDQEGIYTFQSDRHYSVIEDGSVAGGYVFEKDVGVDKTTYIGRKQAPYTYTVNTTNGEAIDFDTVYESNWYALSVLKKGDGSGTYHYAKPIVLEGATAVNETVEMFYANSNPYLIDITNPGGQNSTSSNVYVPGSGDTVTTALIHRDSAASCYGDLLQLDSNGNIVGTMYADGDGMNKYTLSVSDSAGSSALTLKKADLPKVTVKFLDADGATGKASLLTEDEYYLYVDLNRGRGKNHYGYVEKLDLTQATKDYTIPYFYGINEAGKKDYSTDRAYLTDGSDYTVHIVKRHDSAPTLEMCQKKTGVIMYGNGDLVEEAVLNTEGATHIAAPYTTSSSELNGLVKITALPKLKVRTQFFNASAEQTAGATITGKYYLLVSMTKADGSVYYSLVPVDETKSPSAPVTIENFKSAGDDGLTYNYTGTEAISVAVVQTTDGTEPALFNAINGNNCYKYELGALTGDGYKLSGSMNDASKTYTARLDKSNLASDAYKATVTFYDQKNGNRLTTLNPQLDTNEKYYLLASLNSANGANNEQVVGYTIVEVTADTIASANSSGAFEVNLPASHAYQMVDATGKDIAGKTLTFDASKFTMSTRLYHASYIPTTFVDAKAKDDTIDGYDFWENTPASDGKSTQIKLYKGYKKIYKVQVNFSETLTIPSEDPIHIKVEAKHATTGTDIYETNIEVQSEDSWTKVIEDQITNTRIWTTLGQAGNTFSGNEQVTITLSRGGKVIEQGKLTHGCKVDYNTPARTEVSDDEAKTTTITDYVTLTKIDTSHDYDYYSILGEGVGYGITADYLYQHGHIQSNFATNFYYGDNIIEPDLAGHGAIIVIADFALNKGKALEIGGSHVDGTQTVIYLGNGGTLELVRNVEQRDWVHVIPSDTEELTNNMVEPIINHMKQISAELMDHEITLHPDSKYIDLLDFPENATIYLDGDDLKFWIAKGDDGLFITKHKNQMIVFNFDESSDVTIGQYHVQYAPGEDETYVNGNYFHTESPTGKNDSKNVFADELAKHVVYNLASVQDVTVDTYVGMILAPRPDSSMNITGTSAGWIISDGYVTNSGAEWHSVYAEMPDSSTTDLTIYKTMDHEKRSPGQHQVFNFNLDHLITTGATRSWHHLETRPNDSRTVKFTQISEMEDGWNVYRITEDAENIPSQTLGSYKMDDRAVYAFVRYFTVNGTVKIAGTPRYYMQAKGSETPDCYFNETAFDRNQTDLVDAIGEATTGVGIKPLQLPAFENYTRRDGLEIQKKVLGTNNPNARFKFEIKIWLETTDPDHAKIFEDVETSKAYQLSGVPGQTTIEFTKVEEDGQTFGRAYLTMPGNQTAFIAGIPVGAHYSVKEIATIADITSEDTAKNTEVPFTENVSNGYTNVDGEKTGFIIENDASKQEFTNTYAAVGEYVFEGAKKMLGREMTANNGFQFVIKQDDVVIANGTVSAGSEGTAENIVWNPDKLTFTQDDVGEHNYTYTVEEVTDGLPEDIGVLSAVSYELELSVIDNGDGTLTVTRVKPVESADLVFTNTLKAQQTLHGTKTLTGRDMTEGERFVFNVIESEDAEAVVVATGEVTGPTNADTPVNIAFTPITYLYDGDPTHYPKTYVYTITEDEQTLSSDLKQNNQTFYAKVTLRLDTEQKKLVAGDPEYSLDGTTWSATSADVSFINEPDAIDFTVTKAWYDSDDEEVFAPRTITFSVTRDGEDFDLNNVNIVKSGEGDFTTSGNTVTLIAGPTGWPTVQFTGVAKGRYVVEETAHTAVPSGVSFTTSYALNGVDKATNAEAAATADGDAIVIKNSEEIPEDNRAELTLKKIWDPTQFTDDAGKQTVTYELYQVPASGESSGSGSSGGGNNATIELYDLWSGQTLLAAIDVTYSDSDESVSVTVTSTTDQGYEVGDRYGYNIKVTANGNIAVVDIPTTLLNIKNPFKLYGVNGQAGTQATMTSTSSGGSIPLIIEQLTATPTDHATIAALGGTKYGEYTLNKDQWNSGITVTVPKSTGSTNWQYYVVEKDGDAYEATYTQDTGNTLVVTNHKKAQGALKLKKIVQVNGIEVTDHSKASPADGAYLFSIKKDNATVKYVWIIVENGKATKYILREADSLESEDPDYRYWYEDEGENKAYIDVDAEGWATIPDLVPGEYEIVESEVAYEASQYPGDELWGTGTWIHDDKPLTNVALSNVVNGNNAAGNVSDRSITLTVTSGDTVAATARATFTNNKEILGSLKLKKVVKMYGDTLTAENSAPVLGRKYHFTIVGPAGNAPVTRYVLAEAHGSQGEVAEVFKYYVSTTDHGNDPYNWLNVSDAVVGSELTFDDLEPGQYTITEDAVDDMITTVSDGTTSSVSNTITVDVTADETPSVEVTYTNDYVVGKLSLRKVANASTMNPVNGDLAKVAGTYKFTLVGPVDQNNQSMAGAITKYVQIYASYDSTHKKLDYSYEVKDANEGWNCARATALASNAGVIFDKLRTGDYLITETGWDLDSTTSGANMHLDGITVSSGKVALNTADTDATIPAKTLKVHVDGAVATEIKAVFTNELVPDTMTHRKMVLDVNDSTDTDPFNSSSEQTWEDSADYDIGDEIPYRVTGFLPQSDYQSKENYYYRIDDVMQNLEYVENSGHMFAFVKGPTDEVGHWYQVDEYFNITTPSNMDTNDAIASDGSDDINYLRAETKETKGLKAIVRGYLTTWGDADTHENNQKAEPTWAGTTTEINPNHIQYLQFRYKAELLDKANIGQAGNANDAKVYYDNSAEPQSTGWDRNRVFTYKVLINKTYEGDGQETTRTEYATFALYKKYMSHSTDGLSSVGIGDGAAKLYAEASKLPTANASESKVYPSVHLHDSGNYYYVAATISNGLTFEWDGLDDGSYILVELSAPEGYQKMNVPIELSIVAQHDHEADDPALRLESGRTYVNVYPDSMISSFKSETVTTVFNSGNITGNITNLQYPGIKILKIDETTREAPNPKVLQGAQFTIEKWNGSNYVVYRPSKAGSEPESEVVTTDQYGVATFPKIEPGEYKIIESKLPDGYVKLETNDIYINVAYDASGNQTITRYKTPLTVDETTKQVKERVEADVISASTTSDSGTMHITFTARSGDTPATFTVGNQPGVVLPSTGGVGTGVVYGAGAALLLLAVLGLILLNRKRTDGEGIR